jgi:hypothetical protein
MGQLLENCLFPPVSPAFSVLRVVGLNGEGVAAASGWDANDFGRDYFQVARRATGSL